MGFLVDVAGFTVSDGQTVVTGAAGGGAQRMRCASVLKPLLFWVGADLGVFADRRDWARAAQPAVALSANDPTVALWRMCGAEALLTGLAARTGRTWPLEPGGARSFGRVLISAEDLAVAYAALALACEQGDDVAARLLEWMRALPECQTFGARSAAAGQLAVPGMTVGVKSGWFCDTDETRLRTHAVTVTSVSDGSTVGSVVLSAVDAAPALRWAYTKAYRTGDEVLPYHWELAGGHIFRETRAALMRHARTPPWAE
ncbi:MAG: hypothetical protein QOH83_589 [Solirubrobacteraceae bacterium]|nr:hypothetical protein [Solirubrobacteraceae bacterium]